MTEKPDYVRNFSKSIRTEIKHIQGNWYLYEATSKYDPNVNFPFLFTIKSPQLHLRHHPLCLKSNLYPL